MRARRSWLMASLIAAVWIAPPAHSAAAFGTIDSGGQHREHERITRASLACAGAADPVENCFAARATDYLAGHGREFGAVGAPDSDELADPRAHCDNADFLAAAYPVAREQATAGLVACVDHLRVRLEEAVVAAGALLDDEGRVIPDEVDLDTDCRTFEVAENRAKCASLEAFGRVLHGAQDFYAHSNWADEADPARPTGPGNPPGLNRPGPSPVLDLRSEGPPVVPSELTTGCFVLPDQVPGVGECTGRVTHAALNKDTGLVDAQSGATSGPTTPRGLVKDNFAKAVTGAVEETRRQWQDFQAELVVTYGQRKAALMTCALTHDDPPNDCRDRGWIPVVAGSAAVAAALLLILVALRWRRRRRATAHR